MEESSSQLEELTRRFGPEPARYAVAHMNLSALIDFGWIYLDGQAGREVQSREFYLDKLMAKLIGHAETLRLLAPPRWPSNERRLWDASAWFVLTRAIVDTHDVIEYICVHPETDDEIELRLDVWEQHANEHEKLYRQMPAESVDDDWDELEVAISTGRAKLLAHPKFDSLNNKDKSKIRSYEAPMYLVDQRTRNELSGIDHAAYVGMCAYLSSHVHSHPSAIREMLPFRAGTPMGYLMATRAFRYASCFLARSVNGMMKIVAMERLILPPEVAFALEYWPDFINQPRKPEGRGPRVAP